MSDRTKGFLPPLGYLVLSVALFWPVLTNLDSKAIGGDEFDSSAFIWFFAWWPNAILDGADPFVTQALFAPEGYNLAWATSVPGLSLLMAPITLLWSATVSFNLVMILAPVLTASASYALCRQVTQATWPSAVGGLVVGMSTFALAQMHGANSSLSVFALVPLMVMAVLRRAEGRLSDRRFVVLLMLLAAAQVLVSTEFLAMTVVLGALALGAAALIYAERRAVLLRVALLSSVSLGFSAVLVSPLLIAMLRPHLAPGHARPDELLTDAVSIVMPTDLHLGGDHIREWWRVRGVEYGGVGGGYLGLPALAILVLMGWRERSDRRVLLVVACAAMFLIASLGPTLAVGGRDLGIPLPWEAAAQLPLLRFALPVRFGAFTALAIGVAVAMFLAARPSWPRWALAAAAVLALTPNLGAALWNVPAEDPPLFRSGEYSSLISPRDRVLTIPVIGRNTRWAARTNVGFRIVGGYVGAFPPSFTQAPGWRELSLGRTGPATNRLIRRFIREKGVTVVVIEEREAGRWRSQLSALGVPPQKRGGMLVYRLRPPL